LDELETVGADRVVLLDLGHGVHSASSSCRYRSAGHQGWHAKGCLDHKRAVAGAQGGLPGRMTLFGPLPVSFSLHLTRERLGAIAGPWLRNDFLTSRSAGLPASSDRRQRSATPVTDRQAPSELA